MLNWDWIYSFDLHSPKTISNHRIFRDSIFRSSLETFNSGIPHLSAISWVPHFLFHSQQVCSLQFLFECLLPSFCSSLSSLCSDFTFLDFSSLLIYYQWTHLYLDCYSMFCQNISESTWAYFLLTDKNGSQNYFCPGHRKIKSFRQTFFTRKIPWICWSHWNLPISKLNRVFIHNGIFAICMFQNPILILVISNIVILGALYFHYVQILLVGDFKIFDGIFFVDRFCRKTFSPVDRRWSKPPVWNKFVEKWLVVTFAVFAEYISNRNDCKPDKVLRNF